MIAPRKSHSAAVTMELRAGGVCVPLAQLGQDFAIPAEAADLPPCQAEIVLTVDGQTTRMPVFLREGVHADRRRIALERVA
jgi:hypothetical protein